jgi:hypothetical protein
MSWKKKRKMRNKMVKVAVINKPVKDFAELQKWLENIEVISKFVEKTGNRFDVRTKLVETLFNFLSQMKLQLPVPLEKELQLNLMKVLDFFLLYFFISLFLCYFYYSNILICLTDSVINYDFKRNIEIVKWNGNVVNGILGIKRDANLQSLEFFHSYDDVREVLTL